MPTERCPFWWSWSSPRPSRQSSAYSPCRSPCRTTGCGPSRALGRRTHAADSHSAVGGHGRIDLLVNNVTGTSTPPGGFPQLDDDAWQHTFTMTLMPTVRTTRAALRLRGAPVCTPGTDSRKAGAMRKLIYGMNLTLDGYIAAAGDDLGWSGPPSDELFQWWLGHEQASGLSLYGRRLWEAMSSYWPTGDQQPDATPAEIEFARNWRDTPKVVFSSTIAKVDGNTRLVTGDAIAEITRLKAEDGGPMTIGGATLAGAAMRAGLIDEYAIVAHPVLVGSGTPFFTALDSWVNLNLVETRTFPGGVVLTRYETRR
ncbi:conserved hypothetical protein; putative NAD(P)-binding Rossmann-fold and reductase domains [Frankia alni ACN14a]|uniref:Bacterial bifunctional deaminase-reductase C-terminal domain-containing protein n=2 Tax=Frankiaceae TaxID=74712 RepID=Q0RJX0_FRAAA|nr:conserved hypothetical protein; putative NAD(P)-binding Rossmann-fold and reductase domains [Frankia alni ACN14a]